MFDLLFSCVAFCAVQNVINMSVVVVCSKKTGSGLSSMVTINHGNQRPDKIKRELICLCPA